MKNIYSYFVRFSMLTPVLFIASQGKAAEGCLDVNEISQALKDFKPSSGAGGDTYESGTVTVGQRQWNIVVDKSFKENVAKNQTIKGPIMTGTGSTKQCNYSLGTDSKSMLRATSSDNAPAQKDAPNAPSPNTQKPPHPPSPPPPPSLNNTHPIAHSPASQQKAHGPQPYASPTTPETPHLSSPKMNEAPPQVPQAGALKNAPNPDQRLRRERQ